LGIFGAIDAPKLKMVFCLESTRYRLRCDLLLPIIDDFPVPCLMANTPQNDPARA
jgi:hypothetical protein